MQTFRITPKEKIVLTPWFEGEIYKAECIEVKGEFLVRKFQILFNLSWFLFLIGFFIRSTMGYMGPSLIAMSGIALVGFLIQLKSILDLFSGIKEFEKRLRSSFISNACPRCAVSGATASRNCK